jgi:hypothetical protein
VDPEHDGEEVGGTAGAGARAPDVEDQTVFTPLHTPLRCLKCLLLFGSFYANILDHK